MSFSWWWLSGEKKCMKSLLNLILCLDDRHVFIFYFISFRLLRMAEGTPWTLCIREKVKRYSLVHRSKFMSKCMNENFTNNMRRSDNATTIITSWKVISNNALKTATALKTVPVENLLPRKINHWPSRNWKLLFEKTKVAYRGLERGNLETGWEL